MKSRDQIPYYAPDGTSLGFRTLDAAERLVAGGFAKPSYGRKKNLRAIWHCQDDGNNPVETHPRAGTRYSFLQNLANGGRCWNLRGVDQRDETGTVVIARAAFTQVLTDCLVK
jgi:hypothetical protein